MSSEVFRRELSEHWRALAGWCAGVAGYVLMLAAVFPSIEGSPEFDELVENYPEVLKELFGIGDGGGITTGAGYMDVELFSLMLPLLVLVLAIGSGARALAGEEDAGRLELVFSYPIRRSRTVLAKGGAVAVQVVVVSGAAGLAMALVDPVVGLDLSAGNLAQAELAVAALGILFGWLALTVGAAVPSRALAIGIPAAVAAAAYLVNGLHSLAGWLDPLRFASPFWLVGSSPLRGGADLPGVLVVLAAAAIVLVAGARAIERRDLASP
jgi:ABC-2 type transport system permease protein